jgi:hypothetical protein
MILLGPTEEVVPTVVPLIATFWPDAKNLSRLSWPVSTKTNEPLTSSQPSRQTEFSTALGSVVA